MPEVRMEGVEIVKKPEREDVHYNSENEDSVPKSSDFCIS